MKTLKALLFFTCLTTSLVAQINGNDLRAKVLTTVSDVDLENKILFINVWKSSDFESRQNSKEFNRVAKIYREAKLKNGLKGVCFINISLDENASVWNISLQKDSINCDYNFENISGKYSPIIQMLDNKTGSIVVNSAGQVLAKDLKKDDCFVLFRSQITR
jgi:hypothetical protein